MKSPPLIGPPARSLKQVLAAALPGDRAVPAWPQLPQDRTVLTHQGRAAVALGCRLLGLAHGDEVLVPSYNCGTEVDAVRAAGPSVDLYRVDVNLRIDVDDVRNRITPQTRAVYVVHYFGRPHDLSDVAAVCRDRGVLLIEDCALALFASRAGRWVGAEGDAAIFSFRKSLPVPDGGALVLRQPLPAGEPHLEPPSAVRVARRTLGLVRPRRARPGPPRPATEDERCASCDPRPDMPASYYWEERSAHWSVSAVTLGLLAQIDPAEVVARRRSNWARLLAALSGLPGARPLFPDLPPGACPNQFPLLVRESAPWSAALRRRGVEAIPWWSGFHRSLPWDGFPEACRLKRSVVALPVHQDLDVAAMDRIAQAVAETARDAARRSAAPV